MKEAAVLAASTPGAVAAVGLGSFIGIPLDALVYGFMGGIVAILAVPSKSTPERTGFMVYLALAASMLVSMLAAAGLGPVTAELLALAGLTHETAMHGSSFLWGAGAQAGLLLSAIDALRHRIEQIGGGTQP